MGGSGSKTKGVWPFSGSGAGGEAPGETWMCFCDIRPAAVCCCSSLYFDEDGDLAHEFYEETVVTKNGRKKAKLKKIQKNLIPQGIIKLDHPRIHVDFPVILCEI
uniref:Tumor suppressor 2, mitochondrial calcium regulator a n=1 Tax=Cyprinus carpio TaxID=7962 RepID=A0A8C2EM87_CYPCA